MKSTEKTEKAPLLYDLTSLQRDANKYYGFTAQQTLDYTQSLYEKKLVTYPRTDSRYLTDEMGDSTKSLANKMKEKFGFMKALPMHEEKLLNSKKVSDLWQSVNRLTEQFRPFCFNHLFLNALRQL